MTKQQRTVITIIFIFILITGGIASTIAAVSTVIPDPSASKACMIGYKAHCSFTPISTLILIIITLTIAIILTNIKEKSFNKESTIKTNN